MDDEDDFEEIEEKPKRRKALSSPDLGIDLKKFGAMVDERVLEHERDFDETTITLADRQQMKSYAELSLLSEIANKKATMMILGDYSPQDIKYVTDSAKSMSAEARQLATALGIDRKSRTTESGNELELYLPTLHKEALDLINKRAVAIVCPKCLSSEAQVNIRTGWIFMLSYHFASELVWSFETVCPKCKFKFRIDNNNFMKFTLEAIKNNIDGAKSSDFDESLLADD